MKTITLSLVFSTLAFAQYPPGYDSGAAMRAQIARDNARYEQQAADMRAQIARENARYAQQAADMRAQISRDNARYSQQQADFRAQVDRENARVLRGVNEFNAAQQRSNGSYGSYSPPTGSYSGYGSYGSYSPSGSYGSYSPSGSYGGFSPAPRFVEVPLVEGYYVDGYLVQPQRVVPERVAAAPVASGKSPRGQFFPREPHISAVNNRTWPEGSRGYYFIDGRVVFDTELEQSKPADVANANPTTSVPAAPAIVEKPKPTLPTARFDALYTKFTGEAAAAQHAYLEVIDEAIGPRAVDAPALVLPEISKELADEVKRDRFSAVKAMFDNGTLPDIKTLAQNAVWVGRCVPRSSPKSETGAMLGLMTDNTKVHAALVTAATPAQMLAGVDVGSPKKFDGLGADVINQIKVAVAGADREVSQLTSRPREDRALTRDSLFFDGPGWLGSGSVGHRLRVFAGPTKKTIGVLETYSAVKDGASHTDRRVDYLEPIQYCYFTTLKGW